MASTSSSPLSLVLLRPLPCRSLLLSKHRKPFPTPRTGRLAASAAAGAQQRLLRPPETGRWSRSSRSGRDFACLSYNNPPPPSNKVMRRRSISLTPCPTDQLWQASSSASLLPGAEFSFLKEQNNLCWKTSKCGGCIGETSIYVQRYYLAMETLLNSLLNSSWTVNIPVFLMLSCWQSDFVA